LELRQHLDRHLNTAGQWRLRSDGDVDPMKSTWHAAVWDPFTPVDTPDRSAPKRSATRPAARQCPSADAKIVGGEVSWRSLSEMLTTLWLHSAFGGRDAGVFVELFAIVPAGGTSAANYSPQRAPIAYRRRPWLGEDALVLDYELEPQPRTIVVWTACKTEISPEPGKLSLAAFSVAQRSVGGSAFLHGICLIPLADHSMLF
jgi:hypothetical protein